jgi:hypothetical protein
MTKEYKPVIPQIPTDLLIIAVAMSFVVAVIVDRPQPIHTKAEMMRAYKCVADYRDTDKVKYKDCLEQIDRDKYGHTNEL